jgi:predicted acylesterase/phospholipase RssA
MIGVFLDSGKRASRLQVVRLKKSSAEELKMPESDSQIDQLSLQFVFQGGGAKLVALIAAAHAVYEQAPKLGFNISRVSGTSAGAIAACILASKEDPAIFRHTILRHANMYLPKIEKPINAVLSLWHAWRGDALYDAREYREFLRAIFETAAKITHMNQLKIPTSVYATDIRNGKPKKFDGSQSDHTITEALFCSSALPFIFTTFKGQPYVDGGLINNFPLEEYHPTTAGDTLGFTFPSEKEYPYEDGIKEYSKALIFTAMDCAVARSLKQLPQENVYVIKTGIETLEFGKALVELGNDNAYDAYKLQVGTFLKEYIQQKKKNIEQKAEENKAIKVRMEEVVRREIELTKRHEIELATMCKLVGEFHDQVRAASSYLVKQKTNVSTCCALMESNVSVDDRVIVRELIEPISELIFAYGSFTFLDNRPIDTGDLQPKVVKLRGGQIEEGPEKYTVNSLRIPLERESTGEENIHNNIMFFFSPPLRKEEGVAYEISYSSRDRGIFTKCIEGKRDAYYYVARSRKVNRVELVFFIPEKADIKLVSLPCDDQPTAIKSMGSGVSRWNIGRKMTATELHEYDAPDGCKVVGWLADGLEVGDVTGFWAVP